MYHTYYKNITPDFNPEFDGNFDFLNDFVDRPTSNTGSDCQNAISTYTEEYSPGCLINYSVRPDWLQGILSIDKLDDLVFTIDWLLGLVGDKMPWEESHPFVCGIKWEFSCTSVFGCKIAWNLPKQEDMFFKVLLSFPGKFWSHFTSLVDIWDVWKTLRDFGLRSTRADSALDDYTKVVKFNQLQQAIQANNYTGVKKCNIIENWQQDFIGFMGGWTVYLGSKQSDKMLRVYDKFSESNGLINSIRWEAVFKDDRANWVFNQFIDCVDIELVINNREEAERILALFLAGLVTGCVTFSDRESDERADRRQLLPWWEQFITAIAHGIRVPSSRPKPTADSRLKWLFRQVAASYQTIKQSLGEDFYKFEDEFLKYGLRKLKPVHKAFIEVTKREFPKYRKGVYCTVF